MKRLKSLFLKLKASKTLKTYQKPLLVTIVTLLIINLAVIIVAAIVGLIIDPEYFGNSLIKALAHFFSCMLTANTITKLMDIIGTHVQVVILSALVIAIELVLFSGAIVATLTAAIRNYIDKKSNAKGKLSLSDHFVILNWNSKAPDLVYNLMIKGFKNNVVVLSNKTKEQINGEIDSLIAAYAREDVKKRKLKLIVKEGNPLLHGDLDDISIANAAHIVILSREDMTSGDDSNISNNDLHSLKIMLALGNFDVSPNTNIVIETDSEATTSKIENLALTLNRLQNKSIISMSFNRKIGQIIAQTMIDPLMASIYLELLSFDEFEFISTDGEDVENYFETHNSAIPIIKFNKLFVLAKDQIALNDKRVAPKYFSSGRKLAVKEHNLEADCTIFIIGDNKKGYYIKESLNKASLGYGSKFKVLHYGKNENDRLIADVSKTEGVKKVLMLSDDTVCSDSFDANVFVTLIALQTAFKNRNRAELSFVTELLDSRNLDSIKDFNIKNAIISNRMISLLLTQLAMNPDSQKFYESLLTVDTKDGGDEFDIKIKRVEDLIAENENLEFASRTELISSFYISFDKKYMLLGYIRDDQAIFIADHQDDLPITLRRDDSFIFIKY